jgi:hypothetical protein
MFQEDSKKNEQQINYENKVKQKYQDSYFKKID